MAKCSREFFISSEQSAERESLRDLIGIDADIISKEEIEQIIRDGFREHSE
jgi:hypothetical protein